MQEGLIDQAVNPQQPSQPRQERDPPDLQDKVTKQTKVPTGMMAKLRARQPTAQPHLG